LNYWR